MNVLCGIVLITVSILFAGCSNDRVKDTALQVDKELPKDAALLKEKDSEVSEKQVSKQKDKSQELSAHKEVDATPILIGGFLIGGLIDGAWYSPEDFYNRKAVEMDGFEYEVYVDDKKTGVFKGSKPIYPITGDELEEEKYDLEYALVELYNEDKQRVDYDLALKPNWSLFPRGYKRQSTNQPVYEEILKDVLIQQGLESPISEIKEIIRADLDGDGAEEVIMTASNANENEFGEIKKGDNAIVIFRNVVRGKVQQQVLDQYLLIKEPEQSTMYRVLFETAQIADLDGDGIMEVIIRSWYYEGEHYSVFKLINNRLERVAINGWGI
jgi:hypothetical protein